MSKRPKFTVTLLHRFAGWKTESKSKFNLMWWNSGRRYLEHEISKSVVFAYNEVTNPMLLADEDYAIVISVRRQNAERMFDKPPIRDPEFQGKLFDTLCEILNANRVLKRQAKALEADTEKGDQA